MKNGIKNGIILTGGTGSRLLPLSGVINKHLLNVQDKFIIDYPIHTLKNMGVENLNVVLGGNHFEQVVEYLKDGSDFEININYVFQKEPKGISQAINLCKRYLLDQDDFVCILGDNIYQQPFSYKKEPGKAKIVLNDHPELKRLGVATINNKNKIIKIEEKPQIIDYNNKNYAITGCYILNQQFFEYFKQTVPSARNEFEITTILNMYNNDNNLQYAMADGWWIDAGTMPALNEINYLLAQAQKKICSTCKENKLFSEFYSDNGKLHSNCKDCSKSNRRINYSQNKDREMID